MDWIAAAKVEWPSRTHAVSGDGGRLGMGMGMGMVMVEGEISMMAWHL